MRSENAGKIYIMSNQPGFNYRSKYPDNVQRKSTDTGNKKGNINIKKTVYPQCLRRMRRTKTRKLCYRKDDCAMHQQK